MSMNLARTQLFSIATKGITTALGIVQSVIIVRLLSPAEFGITGLVLSVGGVIGVSQHLGIVDGAIREIAVRKNLRHVALVSWVAHLVRQSVTVPLSLGLFVLAPWIAGLYGRPEIYPYIQIFAGALIFQGLQDVLGATLTGMKRFKELYVTQIITAAINIAVFGLLIWKLGVAGFFWAIIVTTIIMVAIMGVYAAKSLRGNLALPSREDIRRYGRRVLRVGAYMYIARIFFVFWQRAPLLVLGGMLAADELGYLNISMTFGARLTILAMALSEVNLSWMSSLFIEDPEAFKERVTSNMQRVFLFMLAATSALLFFTPEILRYVIGTEYLPAEPIIYIMTAAFFLYSLLDIGTSSLFVPADNPRQRMLTFGTLISATGVVLAWLYLSHPSAILAAIAMTVGAVVSYVYMIAVSNSYNVKLVSAGQIGMLALLGISIAWLFTSPSLALRIIAFAVFAAYMLYDARKNGLLPDISSLLNRTGNSANNTGKKVICFAGGFYDAPFWTNRQHIMSRVKNTHPVLYVEPRVWAIRHITSNPDSLFSFVQKLLWWQKRDENLYIIAQWNLLPGSREHKWIAALNHALNRWYVLAKARWLGFNDPIVWIYDTEAAEYLSAFPNSYVMYDCVDDHAAQAGVDRNSKRVEEEESVILERANLVTTTSHHLFELKKKRNPNTHLVLNAGDVELFSQRTTGKLPAMMQNIKQAGPVLGSVGALDSYKVDFDLLVSVAEAVPAWQFVFIGKPVVDKRIPALKRLRALPNVHVISNIPRKEVPLYAQAFDVCLIPYKYSRYNASSFPLKFWEFMATGKPVITSGLPELKPYTPLSVHIKNADEFISATKKALKHPTEGQMERMNLAEQNTWAARVGKILKLINHS